MKAATAVATTASSADQGSPIRCGSSTRSTGTGTPFARRARSSRSPNGPEVPSVYANATHFSTARAHFCRFKADEPNSQVRDT